jgi:hypothetical protein
VSYRVVVATHPADQTRKKKKKKTVGVTRAGVVYELFFTNLPQQAFTACDVIELYLHRGAFEPILADEDREQDPDRWCSHSACGQEIWCVVSQWVWNLRLEVGHQFEPTPLRTTEFAPAIPSQRTPLAPSPSLTTPASGYGPPTTATSWKTGRFTGTDFPLQPDGTLRCPAGQRLLAHERRAIRRGKPACGVCRQHPQLPSLSATGTVSMARRRHQKAAPGQRAAPSPRRWSGPAAASHDWSRRYHRRACMQFLRHQHMEITCLPAQLALPSAQEPVLSRAQRAHTRLSWGERLARNTRRDTSSQVTIKLFGVKSGFATWLGLRAQEEQTRAPHGEK